MGGIAEAVITVLSRDRELLPGGERIVRLTIGEDEAAEERRLWADYYEAMARVLEIMQLGGTVEPAVSRILAEDATAGRAIARIKEIRRIG